MLKFMDPYFSKPKINLQSCWNISCAVTRLIFTSFFLGKILKGLACMVKIPGIKLYASHLYKEMMEYLIILSNLVSL